MACYRYEHVPSSRGLKRKQIQNTLRKIETFKDQLSLTNIVVNYYYIIIKMFKTKFNFLTKITCTKKSMWN